MTDLILRVQRFSRQPLRVRQGNIKYYLADMALRNAVLKTWQNLNSHTTGLYAENLKKKPHGRQPSVSDGPNMVHYCQFRTIFKQRPGNTISA